MGRRANKPILITGGNSGIGLAAAQEFDREGARVAICGLNERTLQTAKETLGAGSLAVRADVSNLPDLDTLFATIKREFGHLDGIFVNAGYSDFRLFEDVTEQSFDKVIAVNFKGIVKLLGIIVSPGNSRYFPDVIATDPPFRQPALSPLFQPSSRIAAASLGRTPVRTADAVWVGSVGQWGHTPTKTAGHALLT